MFSHINSYIRSVLLDQTPYMLALKKYGKGFLKIINYNYIPTTDVILSENLFHK